LNVAFGGLNGAGVSLIGLFAGAIVPMSLFAISRGQAIGGGDVKLFAALGALLGPMLAIEAEFGAFVLLCVFALIRLAFRGRLLRVLGNTALLLLNPFLPRSRRRSVHPESMTAMRMGPAIATAVLSTLFIEHLGRALPWLR
jgi:prepilin peptidase CpaA